MTIASQADVEAVLLRPLTVTETGYVDDLLTRADGLIYGELPGWKFDGVANNQTADIVATGTFEVWLPGRPVVNVDSVTLDGTLLAATAYSWSRFGDLARENDGAWWTVPSDWSVWPRGSTVHVVYDYGLAAPPSELVSLAADLVKVGITSPSASNVQSERFDDYAISYTATAQQDMRVALDGYKTILDHYRFPVPV